MMVQRISVDKNVEFNPTPGTVLDINLSKTDRKVATKAQRLRLPPQRRSHSEKTSHRFSLLRFLGWMSLMVSVRAQQTAPFPAVIELSSLSQTGGLVISGEEPNAESGWSVADAGDINHDGIPDLVIGARSAGMGTLFRSGRSYVIFGKPGLNTLGCFDLSSLSGLNGFVLNGEMAGDRNGRSVASAGDLNDDGIADLVIGAPYAGVGGKSYVIFGKKSLGKSGNIDLGALSGTNGFVIKGKAKGPASGWAVASAGDVNHDGIDDLLIGAEINVFREDFHGAEETFATGKIYVIFGDAKLGASGSLDLATLSGTNGFVIHGEEDHDDIGRSIANAGDLNNDGVSDLVIGTRAASPGGKQSAGKSYVIFGDAKLGASGNLKLTALSSTQGFSIKGEKAHDQLGFSVASAGDVNNDGISDLIVSAFSANFRGRSYIIFGNPQLGASGDFDLSTLSGTNGFVINGEAELDKFGRSVSCAGDLNGDGISDLVVGAPGADNGNLSESGRSYVIFGKKGLGASGSLDLSTLSGANGFTVMGEAAMDESGNSVSSAGDLNHDGISDLVIGAHEHKDWNLPGVGRSYVIFGRNVQQSNTTSTPLPTSSIPLIRSTAEPKTTLNCHLPRIHLPRISDGSSSTTVSPLPAPLEDSGSAATLTGRTAVVAAVASIFIK